MRKTGLFGAGSIGTAVARAFGDADVPGHSLHSIMVRSYQLDNVRKRVQPAVLVTDDFADFVNSGCDIVIEAAGHEAARTLGPALLASGADLCLVSVGVLADPASRDAFLDAARAGGSRVLLPSGAMGGFDGLKSLRRQGLQEVIYTSTKKPRAWEGTPGEEIICRHPPGEKVLLFEGTASDAARLYPKNANLAAAVALAGLGPDRTLVRLIADPAAEDNMASVRAVGTCAEFTLTMKARTFPENPKSSEITSASIIAALTNQSSLISFV